MVLIRTPPNQRIFPLWNTQGLADAIAEETGATNFGTYLGHSPTAERAIDTFTTIPMPRSNRVLGDRIAEYVLYGTMPNGVSVWNYFGVRYIIWRQRINWNDGNGWIPMANRGDDTQNHFDHDHISTNVIPKPAGIKTPTKEGDTDMLIVNVEGTGIFLLRGESVTHFTHPDHVLAFVKAGVPYQDKASIPAAIFRDYTGWGSVRGVASLASMAEEPELIPYEELVTAVQEGMNEVYDEYVQSLQIKGE